MTYTIKELNDFSMARLLHCFLTERQSKTTNIYSPLNKKINQLKDWIEKDMTSKSLLFEILRNNTRLSGTEIGKIKRLLEEKEKKEFYYNNRLLNKVNEN